MLYAYISEGKLNLRPVGLRSSGQEKPDISISFDEREKLVSYFRDKVRDGKWDGHIMCSSSMDFADEDSWPESEAREYMDECIHEAMKQIHNERMN